jgi:hypothetical protein
MTCDRPAFIFLIPCLWFSPACSSTSSTPPPSEGGPGDATGDVSPQPEASLDAPLEASDAPTDSTEGGEGGGCPIIGPLANQVNLGNPQCNACMSASCCNETTTCFTRVGDAQPSDCAQLSMCIGTCAPGDMMCVMACKGMHQQSGTIYSDFQQCLATNCGGGGGPCG